MSRRGNCWANAVAESFFSTLKKERIYADQETAALDLAEDIDSFYNPVRRCRYLGGVSPNEFEAAHRKQKSSAY
jgi:putative transposase